MWNFNLNGRYRRIPFLYWAIIGFRHNSLRPDHKNLEPNVWCALYKNDYYYSKMTINTMHLQPLNTEITYNLKVNASL